MTREARLPMLLLGLFAAWWAALAIAPHYRQDWLLENVLVFLAIPLLVAGHRRLRLSHLAYVLLFVFLVVHEVGAHYTYSEVPYHAWLDRLGVDVAADPGRNHFDRAAHFLYGLCIAPAAIELLDARAPQRGAWRWIVPMAFMLAQAALYELIEWAAALAFGGDLGVAYLGTQGDPWDSQKDTALAGLGAAISVLLLRALRPAPDERCPPA